MKLDLAKYVDNVASLLASVLRWLESADEDEKWWQLQTQVVELCLLELDLASKAEVRARVGGETPSDGPVTRVARKLPGMVDAMRRRNRTMALESGQHALEQLSNLE